VKQHIGIGMSEQTSDGRCIYRVEVILYLFVFVFVFVIWVCNLW